VNRFICLHVSLDYCCSSCNFFWEGGGWGELAIMGMQWVVAECMYAQQEGDCECTLCCYRTLFLCHRHSYVWSFSLVQVSGHVFGIQDRVSFFHSWLTSCGDVSLYPYNTRVQILYILSTFVITVKFYTITMFRIVNLTLLVPRADILAFAARAKSAASDISAHAYTIIKIVITKHICNGL
jgi:hypothetical protein